MLQNFEQPQENIRSLVVGKNKLIMERTNPYGFVKIHFEKGELPKELKGEWTSFDEAAKKIEVYLNNKKKEEDVEVKEEVLEDNDSA